MAEKMDSDRSLSGESTSSSSDSTSSGSTDGDDEALEIVRILGHTFELPQNLCEDYSLFKEVFSMKTWESLEDKEKEHLKTFLPKFKENDKEEKETTLKMLFDYEPFKFTSPLSDFYNDLKLGNFRRDLAKMRKLLVKARKKQQRKKMRDYYVKLLPDMVLSRERFLAAVNGAPPGPIPYLPRLLPKPTLKLGHRTIYQRAKQRYFDELNAVRTEVGGNSSDDENYQEGPDETFKDRKPASPCPLAPDEDLSIFETLSGSSQTYPEPILDVKDMLAAHKLRRIQREVHPELNTNGISLEEIEQRVFGIKKYMFGGPKSESPVQKMKRGPKRDSLSRGKVSEGKTIKKIKDENDVDSKASMEKIKYEHESDSENSSFVDPVASPKQSTSLEQVEIKQEVIDDDESENYLNTSMENYGVPSDTVIKEEPSDVCQNSGNVHLPIKLEDLDGIDMMALPIQLADEAGEVIQVEASADALQEEGVVEVDDSLTETTHANFLSMVRALFPARDAHRASKQQLHARCGAVMKSPIAPLNTWYPLSDDWCAELDSALEFLAGEKGSHPDDFVPYLQYMPKTQMYQWIGAGRDCDSILDRLCDRWLRAMSPRNPPPPKYPTSWTVRPPTGSDISEFRAQERRRFASASKPFTYVQHGYRSVVGPCARAWVSSGCAGTSLLVPDRPRHATFTSLVRDALARLPNGEGTRHDVLTLLKMSQYIAQCSGQALLGAVSAVLERFHTAKRDPVVRFDPRTAVWTYLHRNRTEDDWTKTTSGRSRGAKPAAAISPTSLPPPSSPPPAPLPRPPIAAKPTTILQPPLTKPAGPKPSVTSPPPLVKSLPRETRHTAPQTMEVDGTEELIEASDSDVDVDDSSTPTSAPQLSSAQLLMQATLGQPDLVPPKPKRPTYTPPTKRTFTPKQLSLTKQNKQAALMSQSVKQAKILAEAVKQASATAQNKANLTAARNIAKQTALLSKASTPQALQAAFLGKTTLKSVPKTVKLPTQSPKQSTGVKQMPTSPMNPPSSPINPPSSPMHPPSSPMYPPSPKQMPQSPKPPPSPKQTPSPRPQSPLQPPSPKSMPVRQLQSANKPDASAKQPPLPGKQLLEPTKLPPTKQQPISEKQFPPVYLSKEDFSISGKELPQSAKRPTVEIKPHVVFLAPQSPKQLPSSPKRSLQSPILSQSPMPPQSSMPPPQSPVPAPTSPMPPPQSTMPPPQSTMPLSSSLMPPPQPPMPLPQTSKQFPQTSKQLSQTAKQLSQTGKQLYQTGKLSQIKQPPLIIKHESSKPAILTKPVVLSPSSKAPQQISIPTLSQASHTLARSSSLPTIVATPHKSPLIKQRTSIKTDAVTLSVAKANALAQQISTAQTVIHPVANSSVLQTQKMAAGTRSLLIRPPSLHTSVTASVTPTTQPTGARRGVVRVLSPAHSSSGKSLISPRALLQDIPATKKRATTSGTSAVTTLAHSPTTGTAVVSCVQNVMSTSVPTRTVQLAGGRTLQLSANQTVHFPGGQSVQLSPSHALQLSSLQLPSLQMQHTTHSVRLPSGQTVGLATPQVMQALKASKNQTPRVQTTSTLKTLQTNQTVIPVSSVQLAGQTVQFGNQTVQLAGQSVQLTGHTVKLPSGQSVQVASQNVLPSSVQLAGQTFQLAGGGVQTVQMAGQSVQIPSGALGSQTVQIAGQTVQLAGSQTVQLPSGQTLQLPSGQTLQLAGGVQLAGQNAKTLPQVIRSHGQGEKSSNQPIMAKLLTNAQGQMVSLEGVVGGGRIVTGIRPRPQVRVLSPATRLTRPLLLSSGKPLHNIILQSDGTAVRVTSAGGASTSQPIVISNMSAQTVTTPTTTTPVLKLQQVNPNQQVKLAQGIKIQQASSSATTPTSSGVRSVLMDGQQLKLVSGRHVLARILRPNHPPPQ